ncbi:DUF2958 domain-containing protein [Candidatus Saccharibacteria bacterium]|nr:DUF2958 domain-containing protein [Candidatus Saccharibacteria bacterium]
MSLLTKSELAKMPLIYTQEDVELDDKIVYFKFFTPWTSWTWYAMESDGSHYCFGFVEGQEDELGYFCLRELAKVIGPAGLRIEKDRYFEPTKFKDLKRS